MKNKINFSINEILLFCKYYESLDHPLIMGIGKTRIVYENLNTLRKNIINEIPQNKFPGLKSSISRGRGKFPRIPWVAFHKENSTVSDSLSVAICFGRKGDGVVVGLMSSSLLNNSLMYVKRTTNKNFIDVKGSARTNYNNRFHNPKEFYSGEFSEKKIIEHIIDSLNILFAK